MTLFGLFQITTTYKICSKNDRILDVSLTNNMVYKKNKNILNSKVTFFLLLFFIYQNKQIMGKLYHQKCF